MNPVSALLATAVMFAYSVGFLAMFLFVYNGTVAWALPFAMIWTVVTTLSLRLFPWSVK